MNSYQDRAKGRRYAEGVNTIEEFLYKYYRPDRYFGRGENYAKALLKSHKDDFEKYGHDIISRHESLTGYAIWFCGNNNAKAQPLKEAQEGEE